MKLLVNNSFTR